MGVEEDLLYRIENGVAWLTINRPQVGNAMTPEVRDRMRDIINDLNVSYEARAIVIHAAPYVNPGIIRERGKLGRSEGCFAVDAADLNHVLGSLGPGRMIYADKL